jgi:hypothetical protein
MHPNCPRSRNHFIGQYNSIDREAWVDDIGMHIDRIALKMMYEHAVDRFLYLPCIVKKEMEPSYSFNTTIDQGGCKYVVCNWLLSHR